MPQLRRARYPVEKLPSLHWLIYPALALAILAAYYPVIHYDFVNYDDPDYTTGNPHIRAGLTGANIAWAFTSSYEANWIPLSWISHMADRQFFGWKAGADHAVNLAMHILTTLLLFALLKRMTHTTWPSAFTAFAFGLHPLHVESVAWIAERKDVLCAFFFFLTLWLYLGYIDRPKPPRYALVTIAFACALMSKPMAVTLPFLMLVLDFWPLRRLKPDSARKLVMEKIPLIALAIGASIITFLVQRGAGGVIEYVPFATRFQNAFVSYAIYLWKFIWPSQLAVFYPYPAEFPPLQWMLAALVLIVITAFVIFHRAKQPYLMAGWLWFLGTLLPVIGLVQVGAQSHADRYMYLPLVGLAIMFFFSAADFTNRAAWRRPPASLLAVIVFVAWIAATRANLSNWRDSSTLFIHALGVTENNFVAYSNLASAQRDAGQIDDALQNFRRALEIWPHFANAQNGLGEALSAQGRFDEALPHLLEAVRLEPGSLSARINLGAAYSRHGLAAQAEQQYRAALNLDAASPEAHCGLGIALDLLGRRQEALPQLEEAVRLNPDYSDGHYNLGRILALAGRVDEASEEFREAIRVDPNNPEAYYNFGVALAQRGRMKEAADQFEKAVDLKPEYVNARFNYASALAQMEDYKEAIDQFRALLRLAPDFEPARESLDRCIALQNGQPDPGDAQPRRSRRSKSKAN